MASLMAQWKRSLVEADETAEDAKFEREMCCEIEKKQSD